MKFRFSISALPWLSMMWHEFRSAFLLCQFFQRFEVPLPHFRPALTDKDMKFSFSTSALLGLLKVWSFASTFPLCLDWQRCEIRLSKLLFCQDFERSQVRFRTCSTRTSKDVKVHFRISSLPGLPKMWSSASALLLCLDCQRSEVRLPRQQFALIAKKMWNSASALPLCNNCRVAEVPIPLFRSAIIPQDLKLRFGPSALPWLPKTGSSASSVLLYVLMPWRISPLERRGVLIIKTTA